MCEIMALSFAQPEDPAMAMGPFGTRGEENPHGWGLGWYPDQALALVKEPVPWMSSPLAAFLQSYAGLRSRIYIAHVRHKTTGGEPTQADTHPFARELLGRDYCFAHNGTLKGVFDLPLGRYDPVGGTDSEHYFCHLLGALANGDGSLSTPESWRWLHGKLTTANALGQLNFLLSDGERLFCYHDAAGYKGLNLCRLPAEDRIGDAPSSRHGGYVIATRPFGAREWESFHPGELIVFEAGKVRFSSHRDC